MADHRRHSWIKGMEAFETIRSYSADAERALREAIAAAGLAFYLQKTTLPYETFFDCVPPAHIEFFQNLLLFHQNADCVCVHGGLDPQVTTFEEQTREAMIWGTRGFPGSYGGTETIVYGHWNNAELSADGWPRPRTIGRTLASTPSRTACSRPFRCPRGQ